MPHRTNFNSRPSARGDQTTSGLRTAEIFQFTPLREGRRLQVEQNSLNTLFQFTPLREGRLVCTALHPLPPLISIHAPPRGATEFCVIRATDKSVFQFTPLREGRRRDRCSARAAGIFQFTPLREGRPAQSAFWSLLITISIHAPPRGATFQSAHQPTSAYFNSRPSARGDARYWRSRR